MKTAVIITPFVHKTSIE